MFEVDYQAGIPKIESIEFDKKNKQAIAYVKVKNESFYLSFCFDILAEITLTFVDTAPLYVVNFSVRSKKYSLIELLNFIKIKPSSTQNGGKENDNSLNFESYKKPGKLIDKINYLLDILEGDKKGIKTLIKKTRNNVVWISIVFYNGYGTFTDLYLPKKVIKRLSSLGLEVVFDIYAMPYAKKSQTLL
ncbi:MAG: DUF4279 domain-containing protein [Bacteroidia bacterium]